MPYLFRAFGTHLFLHRFALLLLHLTALGRVCGQTVLNLNRLTFFSFNANILIANLETFFIAPSLLFLELNFAEVFDF